MPVPSAKERFIDLTRAAVREGTLVKVTLGKYRGPDPSLRNIFVRPVTLKSGPHLAFLWRHATRDITKNLPPDEALAQIQSLVSGTFLDAHLFTSRETAQFESQPDGSARIRIKAVKPALDAGAAPASTLASPSAHDAAKHYSIPANARWLRSLGVTNERGQPREGMTDKYRQIQKFAELLSHLVADAGLGEVPPTEAGARGGEPLHVVDMGSGKGYLTFAVAELLGNGANVRGIEARPELVALCNTVACENDLSARLSFSAGTIADAELPRCDILIALHACDTATDDALARGIAAGARLLVVAPCCQKELRPQLKAPAVLSDALRHGIFQERQAEFVTDALRAQLLEWAGYRTKVFEFISTEHTAKNLMIAAIKQTSHAEHDEAKARRASEFASFYGIRQQRLAQHLGFALEGVGNFVPQIPS